MPAQLATMTAARAIIKVNGVAVGYMKNLRVSENKQRGSVMGLGEVTKRERPLLAINCTWSCDFYLIDLSKTGIPGLESRNAMSVEQYKHTQALLPNVVNILILKKDVLSQNGAVVSNGIVTTAGEGVLATLEDVYLDNTSWDLSENQISGFSQSGEYTTPILLST